MRKIRGIRTSESGIRPLRWCITTERYATGRHMKNLSQRATTGQEEGVSFENKILADSFGKNNVAFFVDIKGLEAETPASTLPTPTK